MKASYLLFRHVDRGLSHLLAVCVLVALSACEHLPLYNKEKHALAESAQETYLKAKVTETYTVQEENLKKLLQAEVDAINESAALRLDIALLQMADDRAVPDGSTSLAAWYSRVGDNIGALSPGGSSIVQTLQSHRIQVQSAEEDILLQKENLRVVEPRSLKSLPSCAEVLGKKADAETWPYLAGITDGPRRSVVTEIFLDYVDRCQTVAGPLPKAGGRIGAAHQELIQAEEENAKRQADAAALAKRVNEAAARLKAAIAKSNETRAAVAATTEAVGKAADETKKAAEEFLKAVEMLNKAGGSESKLLISEENIKSINTVLTALGSGQIEAEGTKDDRLVVAAASLRQNILPLAADMAALLDHARAPPVSNLILELQHQTIEQDYAKRLIQLSDLRITLLRARYQKLVDQAIAWRQFRRSLCTYAALSDGRDYPESACDDFLAVPVNAEDATCTLKGEVILDCALKQTWNQAIGARVDNRTKRELWGAVYHYAEAVEAERAAQEAEFRLADIRHREVLAAQRSAIDAWSNLVEVPVGQLAAYHASGIQPEALAQAIATLLGLTAVGAGAAQ
jgi:hypothetical protein